jgi:META domain
MFRRRSAFSSSLLALSVALSATSLFSVHMSAAHAGESFPFGIEMMLDTKPLRGSKRVPMLQVEENGAASIDLWCVSLRGQATLGDIAFTLVPDLSQGPGNTPQIQCDDDRKNRDAELLAALTQVTGWRKSGESVELSGPTPLRFHLMTN